MSFAFNVLYPISSISHSCTSKLICSTQYENNIVTLVDHEDQSVDDERSSECTYVFEYPLSAPELIMHGTSCLNPVMKLINWFWYNAKPKFSNELPKCAVVNQDLLKIHALILWATCAATPLWCHYNPGARKSAQNVNANMCIWETFDTLVL